MACYRDSFIHIYPTLKLHLKAQPVTDGGLHAQLSVSPSQHHELHVIRFDKMEGAQSSLHLTSHTTLHRSLVTIEGANLMSIYTHPSSFPDDRGTEGSKTLAFESE
jgi:hypothetical protein